MRSRLRSKLIAALLAPALLASRTAQGLLPMRCGAMVRTSCCCPKEAPPPLSTLTHGMQMCCDKLVVPSLPAQPVGRALPTVSAPVLVPALGPASVGEPVNERIRQVPRLDPLPAPLLVLANCTLLI